MILASFLAMLVAAPLSSDATNPASNVDDHKIVCQMDIVTGSQIKQRTCRTKSEWTRIEQENQEQVRRTVSPQDCAKLSAGVFNCGE